MKCKPWNHYHNPMPEWRLLHFDMRLHCVNLWDRLHDLRLNKTFLFKSETKQAKRLRWDKGETWTGCGDRERPVSGDKYWRQAQAGRDRREEVPPASTSKSTLGSVSVLARTGLGVGPGQEDRGQGEKLGDRGSGAPGVATRSQILGPGTLASRAGLTDNILCFES